MVWNPKYAENRKAKELADPEYREKRMAQGKAKDPVKRKEYMQNYVKENTSKFRRTPEQQQRYNEKRKRDYAESPELREKIKAQVKEWNINNPGKKIAQRLTKYNITMIGFQNMMESQNGKCAICGYSETTKRNFFPVVDHCHASEVVRGLLCMNCNMGLGKFKDSPELLEKAAEYLRINGAFGAD